MVLRSLLLVVLTQYSCVITSTLTGEILGELWSVVSEGSETWSEVAMAQKFGQI